MNEVSRKGVSIIKKGGDTVSDAELNREIEGKTRELAAVLDKWLKELYGHRKGFALFVFDFGGPGVVNYISNGERSLMIKAMKETIKRFEKAEDIPASIGSVQ